MSRRGDAATKGVLPALWLGPSRLQREAMLAGKTKKSRSSKADSGSHRDRLIRGALTHGRPHAHYRRIVSVTSRSVPSST